MYMQIQKYNCIINVNEIINVTYIMYIRMGGGEEGL